MSLKQEQDPALSSAVIITGNLSESEDPSVLLPGPSASGFLHDLSGLPSQLPLIKCPGKGATQS